MLAKQVILKEFPCRLKRNGRLYICQKAVAHYSKLFGLEREVRVPDVQTRFVALTNARGLVVRVWGCVWVTTESLPH